MEKSTPVRKPHTSTADLLTWTDNPPEISPAPPSSARSHQPSDGIGKVVFGGQVTDEEVASLNKRKPCSGYKMKEMSGSGIFKSGGGEEETAEAEDANPSHVNKTSLRMYKAMSGISHISFGEEGTETAAPKKPITITEAAKQRELSGTLESQSEEMAKKQISTAKNKELTGNDIFAPPPEIQPRSPAARPLALRESITIGEHNGANDQPNGASNQEGVLRTAKKIPEKKFSELNGNDIFKEDPNLQSSEKPLSSAKLREISGNNIFADEKGQPRDYFGGVRKPPGGESSIALV